MADAARQLQSWWIDEWTVLFSRFMSMKPEIKENISAEENKSYELKRAGEKDAEV